MFAIPSFFGYNTTFVSTPVATAATGVGETSFTANWNAFAGASYYLLDVSTSSSFSSFVLQDQVVYTNSYAVTGLTSNTTYYYRLRASTTYDTDAEAFFTRVSSNGGSLTTTEQQAVNSLVIQMKADGIWTAMKAIYPMVGGGTGSTAAREAACAQNLKSSSFTGSFSSGWTFASTGVKGDGLSAYFDTGLKQSDLLQNSQHLCIYSMTDNNNSAVDFGMYSPTTASYLVYRFSGLIIPTIQALESNTATTPYANSLGFILGSRTDSTTIDYYQNEIAKVSFTKNSTALNNTLNFYLGAYNSNGSAALFSTREFALASVGEGFTSTQASNYNTAVQAFQTTLARQI
jgi:hypothetical protein